MKRIITYGTFDLLHIGHLKLLERAKALGDFLIVAVSTDEFNVIKNKKCTIPYHERVEIVAALKCVDMVIPESNWGQKENDIKANGVSVFVMGDDWENKFDELREFCEVVYLSRTKGVSTTSIKRSLK